MTQSTARPSQRKIDVRSTGTMPPLRGRLYYQHQSTVATPRPDRLGTLLAIVTEIVTDFALLASLLLVTSAVIVMPQDLYVVALAALASSVMCAIAYRMISLNINRKLAQHAQRVSPAQVAEGTAGVVPLQEPPPTTPPSVRGADMMRTAVATLAVLLLVLALALVLFEFNLADKALVFGLPIALFPFSYLAYVAFQRNIRIERLKRDFYLLDARWDDQLFFQSQGFFNFALHIVLAVAATVLGILIFFLPPVTEFSPQFQSLIDEQALQAMRYGFIGAYLFAAQLIYRRYTTYDLQPTVYLYCALTIISGLAFNYVTFQAISTIANNPDLSDGLGGGVFAIIAFALGFFPLLALQWISRAAYGALGLTNRRSEALPLSLIDGISQLHETRLRDHGVDNVQNLASVDIPFLLVNTTFSAQEVIDWVDQAILYMYVAPSEIESFRRGRIRTVSDFRDTWRTMYMPTGEHDAEAWEQTRTQKALQLQSTPDQLDLLFRATERGPNIQHIMNYWRNADIELVRLLNYKYNALLEESLFLSEEQHEELAERRVLIDQYCRESDNGVQATNGQSLAGLGRLTMQLCLNPSTRRSERVESAINYYIAALDMNARVNEQSIDDLKFLTDVQMGFVDDELKRADLAKADNELEAERKHLERAQTLTQGAVQASRRFYGNGSCNISYLSKLAEIKRRLGEPREARRMLNDALELAQSVRHFNPDLIDLIKAQLSTLDASLATVTLTTDTPSLPTKELVSLGDGSTPPPAVTDTTLEQ